MSGNGQRMRALLVATGTLGLMAMTQPAFGKSRVDVAPYLEVDQVVIADIKGGNDDVLTYSTIAAGLDASIATQRAEAGVNVRYERRFGWGDNLGDEDVVSGLARARIGIIRNDLSIEGGAIATRVRSGLNGANGSLTGNVNATSKVYSGYVGPTLATHVGELSVNAAYRLGYTKVTDDVGVTLPGGQNVNSFDDSINHSATFSVGMQPGNLPVGWSVGGGYNREDASQLDQRYEDKYLRADITVPVTATAALVGGIGYEDIKISNRDAVRDASGNPLVASNGRYVTDKSSPRKLSYDQDGIIWDAGVLWRPSRRTSLEARVGRRYGSMNYTGSFSWQPGKNTSVSVSVFDGIDSFGRLLNGNLAGLSSDFNATRNPFSGDINNCAYSTTGGGQCFNDALSAIGTANFRRRGIAAQFATQQGRTSWGAGAGYSRRTFLAGNSGTLITVDGARDENYYANLFASRKLDDRSGIDGTLYANYFDSGLTDSGDVLNTGAFASYYRNFGRKLTATASVGVDSVDPKGVDSVISALGQVGLRYQF